MKKKKRFNSLLCTQFVSLSALIHTVYQLRETCSPSYVLPIKQSWIWLWFFFLKTALIVCYLYLPVAKILSLWSFTLYVFLLTHYLYKNIKKREKQKEFWVFFDRSLECWLWRMLVLLWILVVLVRSMRDSSHLDFTVASSKFAWQFWSIWGIIANFLIRITFVFLYFFIKQFSVCQ